MDRLNNIDNPETGGSLGYGFNYELNKKNSENLSMYQCACILVCDTNNLYHLWILVHVKYCEKFPSYFPMYIFPTLIVFISLNETGTNKRLNGKRMFLWRG